jgi:anti-sigma regulatory factor (Ser/Thr protein kinase)
MPSRESGEIRKRIQVAGPTALGDAIASTRLYALEHELNARDRARLCIIVEEVITNLCEHGVCESDHEITLELFRLPSGLGLVFEDNGAPFDPRMVSAADDMPQRGGGAGLRLVRAWSEIIGYESGEDGNRLELMLTLSGD